MAKQPWGHFATLLTSRPTSRLVSLVDLRCNNGNMYVDGKCDSEVKAVVTRANVFSLVKSLMCRSWEQLCEILPQPPKTYQCKKKKRKIVFSWWQIDLMCYHSVTDDSSFLRDNYLESCAATKPVDWLLISTPQDHSGHLPMALRDYQARKQRFYSR